LILKRHSPDDRLVELRLPLWTGIDKTEASDVSAFRARNVDFVDIKTHLSRGLCWNS